MSASTPPRLPDEFGNPWMSNLQEIETPESVSFTPETIGWYVLAGLILLGLLWLGWRYWKRWRGGGYRRVALKELEGMCESPEGLSELLKRVALTAYPRTQVAELSGDDWLGFLDGTLGTAEFTRGVGRWLPALTYDPDSRSGLSDGERRALFALTRRWIRGHR